MTGDASEALDYGGLMRQLILARNAAAVRRLAAEEGLSAEELAALLREELARQAERGGEDRLGPRYDISTGQYTTLEEWVKRVISGR